MIYQYQSVKKIVDKIYTDFGSPEELEIWDIIEWSGQALNLIGAATQYVDRIMEIDINNHVHPLPCDFHTLNQISYKGRPLLLMSATMGPGNSALNAPDNYLNSVGVDEENFPLTSNEREPHNEHYYIQNGCIATSFREGTIVMSYKAIQTDEEGFPMVPDNEYYFQALTAYCQSKIDRREWRKGNITRDIYSDSKSDWLFYVKAAASAALMPNKDKVENFKNNWLRLKPMINQHSTFFSGGSIREIKKLQ